MHAAKNATSIEQELIESNDSLARECSKLDPEEEQTFADVGISTDLAEWPVY